MSENVADFGAPEPVQQPQQGDGFGAPEPLPANDLAAAQAARGVSPEQAAQALALSKKNGTAPSWTADNVDGLAREDQRAQVEQKLDAAPGLARYAGQSDVHAAAIKDDLDALSNIEWGLTGRWEMVPEPVPADAVGPYAESQRAQGGRQVLKMTVPPFWAQVFSDAMKEQKYVALTTKAATVGLQQKMPENGVLPEGEVKDLLDLEKSLAVDRTYGADGRVAKVLVGTVKALPSLGALVTGTVAGGAAGTAVAGPVGTVAGGAAGGLIANFAESYGPLYRQLSQLTRDDGTHLLTDDEANGIAFAGAAGTSAAVELLGAGFIAKLPGAREVLNRLSSSALSRALARPGVASALARAGAQYGKNYLAGIAMMVAQSGGTAAIEEAAKASKGAPTDWGRVAEASARGAGQAANDFAVISAYHPVVEAIGAVSRARADAAGLTHIVEQAEQSKLLQRSPELAQELVQQIGGDSSVLIDREAWDKRFGDQASAKAAEVLGDGGKGYAEAQATGAPLRVPADAWIAKLVPSGDARELLPDTKSAADILTQNEATAKGEEKPDKAAIDAGAMAVYDDYRQKAVAAGRDASEADAVARTTAAAFKVWGEKLKTSPMDLYSRYGLGISAGGEPGPDAMLQSAYHGSPHVFDAFSMQHIGSGEGAQVYGHGLYFAEKPEVAKQYRDALADTNIVMKGLRGADLVPDTPENEAFHSLTLAAAGKRRPPEEVLASAVRQQDNYLRNVRLDFHTLKDIASYPPEERAARRWTGYEMEPRDDAGLRNRIAELGSIVGVQEATHEYLKSLKPEDVQMSRGALYTVDLPEKEQLLDYDKPLSEQPKPVQEAISKLLASRRMAPSTVPISETLSDIRLGGSSIGSFPDEEARRLVDSGEWINHIPWSGGTLYAKMVNDLFHSRGIPRSDAAATVSEFLRAAGIPGLRYLDRGSRAKGEGTHNFVIWDESKIRILERQFQGARVGDIAGAPGVINRGFIEWTAPGGTEPRRFDIHLLETADRSTLAHETFHFLSEVMGDLAGKDPELGKDYRTLVRFMGYDSPEARSGARVAEYEERASHAWEQYLATGKAPTPALDGAFARFKGWLGQIYGGVKGIADQFAGQFGGRRLRLSKDVREVFDRMLGGSGEGPLRNAEREFATQAVNDLRIRDISPAYYDRAAARAAQKAIDLAVAAVPKGHRDTLIITPHQPQGERARYEVVEAGTLVPSHNPNSFTPNEAYPAGVQERFYEGQQEEQMKVATGAASLNPALLLTNSPSPLDGPPIVTGGKKHLVLGGNGRTMMIQRAFKDHATRDRYKQALVQRATDFGMNAADVEAMKAPVLVRMVPDLSNESAKPELVNAVRRFNEGLTQQLSPRARSIAEARTLSPQTMLSIGDLLSASEGDSLRDILRDRPGEVLGILRRDGIVNAQNQAQWVAGDGLTPEGKDRVEGMFLGRVMENEARLHATSPQLQGKIERAAPALLRVEGVNPALDVTPLVREAIDILNDARSRDLPLEDVLSQGALFGEKLDPAAAAMARFLDSAGQKKVTDRFNEWAHLAAVDPRQGSLFGGAPTQGDALGVLLGDKEAFKDYQGAAPAAEAAPPAQERAPATEGEPLPDTETAPVGLPEDTAAQIQQFHQQHQQAHEFATVARDVREEMQDAFERLKERATSDTYRQGFKRAGQEFLDVYDQLMEAVGAAPKRNNPERLGLDVLLARMQSDGAIVAFDEQQIAKLLENPRSWDKLTPNEARNVVDATKNIRTAANEVNRITLGGRQQGIRDVVAKIASETSKRPDHGAPLITDSARTAGEEILRKAQMINADNLKPETVWQKLGDTGQALFEKTIDARNEKKEMYGRILRYFTENFADKMPKKMREARETPVQTSLTIPANLNLDGTRMNAETLWMAFLNLGTASNEDRLDRGYGWDKQQVLEEIGRNIPKDHLDFLQGVLSYSDQVLWPLIEAHAEKKAGVAPPKLQRQAITIPFPDGTEKTYEGGYFPAKYNREVSTLETRRGVVDGIGNFDPSVLAVVANSFTKERASSYKDVIDLNWGRYPGHIAGVLHYLAYDGAVTDLAHVMRDGEFRAIVQRRVGQPYMEELDDWLRIVAHGGTQDGGNVTSYTSQLLSRALRSRAVSNAIAFSLPIALGQESHVQYAIVSGEISAKNGTAAMARALLPEVWRTANETFSELQFRSDNYAQDFRKAMSGKDTTNPILRGIDETGFAMMRAADAMLSHVIADAAYNDARDAKMSHEAAVAEANRKVRKLMPTHNVLEMAPVVRDRGALGALMLFRGLPNVVWQVESGLYDRAAVQAGQARGVQQTAAATGRIALNTARAVASVAVLHMLGRFLMGHGKQDEDGEGLAGWGNWAVREAIGAQFTRIPFARDLAQPVIDALVQGQDPWMTLKKGNADMLTAPALATAQRLTRDLGKMGADGEPEDRVQAAIDAALTVGGAGGATSITRTGRYLYDLQQGNTQPRGLGDLLGGIAYGERQSHVAKNPATFAQDLFSGE